MSCVVARACIRCDRLRSLFRKPIGQRHVLGKRPAMPSHPAVETHPQALMRVASGPD